LDDDEWVQVSPARLLDFEPIPQSIHPADQSVNPADPCSKYHQRLAEVDAVVDWSLDHVLDPYLADLQARRRKETDIIRDYLRRSFDVLIARSQGKLIEYQQFPLWGS